MLKLQHLAVIFAIIIMPISLVLGYYIRSEIDTLKLQASYDKSLIDATYDAIKAFQINTSKENFSQNKAEEKREVEAAIDTFISSFATRLGVEGYGESGLKPYIPAILFTLNSSFYIYAPTYNANKDNINTGKVEHILKPYFTYTARYKKGSTDVYISYSIDNYITITGIVNNKYENRSGYLIDDYETTDETLSECILIYDKNTDKTEVKEYRYAYFIEKVGNSSVYVKKYYDSTAKKWFGCENGVITYYKDSIPSYIKDTSANAFVAENGRQEDEDFTKWVLTNLGSLTVHDMVLSDDATLAAEIKKRNSHLHYLNDSSAKIFVDSSNYFDNPESVFNVHKNDIIRMSINENLSSAIAGYNERVGTTNLFRMPTLKENEWDQITRNICAIAFVQGLPTGFKTYNSYAVINNTENKNYLDQDDLVFISDDPDDDNEYHRIDCKKLSNKGNLQGYKEIEFEPTTVEVTKTDKNGTPLRDSSGDVIKEKVKYYKHQNYPCYYCIVSNNYDKVSSITGKRLTALRRVLSREKEIQAN